ncbi:MAG TPA: SDR family oxidoreductase [Steroidobacteraceae bacterium]|nr:SDR family oxidoreductase [Steroidobacteraceae bacterium]
MGYFVTGGTGFIGRHLIAALAERGEPIHVLVRAGSRARFERVQRDCGTRGELLIPVEGDLEQPLLGVSGLARLRGRISHFLHLGALYDLAAGDAALERANVSGTRNALDFAHEVQAGCFHLVSSIASAGLYPGIFTEAMFEEACGLDHPYFRTKHESEALIRSACRLPWRIYRPGMVVGHSRTGEMDKIDGPYYLFKLIQKLRDAVPRWVPLVGFEGGHINVVPVDFVAAAIAHLAHVPGQDGRCFHLTDSRDRRVGEVSNIFARAAHAPTMTLRLEAGAGAAFDSLARAAGERLQPLRRLGAQLLHELAIPGSLIDLLNYPTRFDNTQARRLLGEAGIQVPPLEDYAWRLWDYWERHLDPELFKARNLQQAVRGKRVVVTGGSSGIGRATALKLAAAGARVLIVARDPQKLAAVRAAIEEQGAAASVYACDITDEQACQRLIARVTAEHGGADILINNAGRSIRRAIEHSYDRFHDYERVMRLNYFAAVRMTLGFLPGMVQRGAGQVINISSIGVLSNAARFAAYNASKAALEAFTRCAAGEFSERGVHFSVVNLPLVRTPMVEPTRIYRQFNLIPPERAADMVCAAIIERPQRLATGLGTLAQLVEVFAPRLGTALMSESFRIFPDSEAAGAAPGSDAVATPDMVAFAALLHGIHT